MFRRTREDIRAVLNRDPAARGPFEVLLFYPGLKALWFYRIAHALWNGGLKLPARMVSQFSRFITNIEIHPGASIGRSVFIDHGAGVVIGETAEVGDYVTMYQGVVLGGVSREKKKRHPTIGCEVVIGAGSIILGPIHIGDCAKVGANSVVLHDVAPKTTVVGIPAREAGKHVVKNHEIDLDHGKISDPVKKAVDALTERIMRLEEELQDLKERTSSSSKRG